MWKQWLFLYKKAGCILGYSLRHHGPQVVEQLLTLGAQDGLVVEKWAGSCKDRVIDNHPKTEAALNLLLDPPVAIYRSHVKHVLFAFLDPFFPA
jgi:hypothetical protein